MQKRSISRVPLADYAGIHSPAYPQAFSLFSVPVVLVASLLVAGGCRLPGAGVTIPKTRVPVAAVVTVYRHNSHADIIASRLLQTYTLDGKGAVSPLRLAALYTDQIPLNDTSRSLAASYGFPIFDSIGETSMLGGDQLAVDGVLLIGEHGDYPRSPAGNTQYPKRRFWDETVAVFRRSDRVVPVFMDKHLADNWEDAKAIVDEAQALKIPLMAGSSVPLTWRKPAADVRRGAKLKEIVVITYGSTDHYGFHALEIAQALAEQRRGGETGIVAVQCLTNAAVWAAMDAGVFGQDVFDAAWNRLPRHLNRNRSLKEAVPKPVLFLLTHADGLRVAVIELNGAAGEWSGAWKYASGAIDSCQFWTQEGRPGAHFTLLLNGIERMILTGQPTWPVERTLMTSGALEALLESRLAGGERRETPHLTFAYPSTWRWREPPPPPPSRPWAEQ